MGWQTIIKHSFSQEAEIKQLDYGYVHLDSN